MSKEPTEAESEGWIDISRRRLLAGVGTAAGAASAASGVAYFTDTEPLGGNQLSGGSLDLKVGWEEHYSDWSDDESDGLENEILMEEPDDAEMYVGLPDPEDPLVWVHQDDSDTFMQNTAVEAFPDPDDDGSKGAPDFEYDTCEMGADLPEDLDPSGENALRTQNDDTWDGETPLPIINLDDVKPGDFGEVTFSFHLCDNPGYVWMNGGLDEELTSENGLTDPEMTDSDEDQTLNEDGEVVPKEGVEDPSVELLDAIQTVWWYDDGDNLVDDEGVIFRGSLRESLNALSSGYGIPLDGDRETEFDEIGGDPAAEERECFEGSVDHHVGFAWYLPLEAANEIQTDSVGFDLGFYAEQCRHNDGAGAEADFRPLFDGESLSGWHQINGEAEFSVEDGAIVGESVFPSPNSFLTSFEMFDDFELRMEVGRDPSNVPEPLNSGIQIRSNSSQEKIEAHGPQAEIGLSDDPMFPPPQPGRVWGESLGTGWMSTDEPTTVFDDTGWNDYRIRAEDDRLRVWVNGTETADVDLSEPRFDEVRMNELLLQTGFIGLQVHGVNEDETGRTVRWRNIRIKELDEDEWTPLPAEAWINDTGAGSASVSEGVLELSDGESFFVHSPDSYDDFSFETWVRGDAMGSLLFRNESADTADGYRVDIDPTDSQLTGSLYNSATDTYLKNVADDAPSEEAATHAQEAFHPDQWNYLRVEADGEDIRMWVNGITTANLTNDAHDSGFLGLQHLGDSGTLEFREMAISPIEEEPTEPEAVDLLIISATPGFRHGNIEYGLQRMQEESDQLAEMAGVDEANIDVIDNEDGPAEEFPTDASELEQYDTIVWFNTISDVLPDPDQRAAFEEYIQNGGGYAGIHAAADTHHPGDGEWDFYMGLLGDAYFVGHPEIQEAQVSVTDRVHPSTEHLPARWNVTDEWYDYSRSPRGDVHVLATLDEDSYEGAEMENGRADHPITWAQEYQGGRSWYTGRGHTEEAFDEEEFIDHIFGGILWSGGFLEGDATGTVWSNYQKTELTGDVDEPMKMDFTPDGRLFFTERATGDVHVIHPDGEITTAATLDVYNGQEDGAQGIAFDPDFEDNGWVYIYYSPAEVPDDLDLGDNHLGTDMGVNRLSRFTVDGDSIDLDSETQIIDVTVQRNTCCHTGGDIAFGPDGEELYLSAGDDTNPFESSGYTPIDERDGREPFDAQRSSGNTNDLRGSILRIIPQDDGGYEIPDGNLFTGDEYQQARDDGLVREEIYVMGLRNPFTITVDDDGRLYYADYGPDSGSWSPDRGPNGIVEFNIVEEAQNAGWPYFVGPNVPYVDYDFETEESGDPFDPEAPVNDSPNNTGLEELPPPVEPTIHYPNNWDEFINNVPAYAEEYAPDEVPWPSIPPGGAPMSGPVYQSDEDDAPAALPQYYDGKWFIMEWGADWLKEVAFDDEGDVLEISPFLPNFEYKGPMDMKVSPDGVLYLMEYGEGFFPGEDPGMYRIDHIEGVLGSDALSLTLDSEEVAPGESTIATTTLTNVQNNEVTDVELSLSADDDGIDISTDDSTTLDSLAPGDSGSVEWEVAAASDLSEGNYTLTAQVAYMVGGTEVQDQKTVTLTVVEDEGPAEIPQEGLEAYFSLDGDTAINEVTGNEAPTQTATSGAEGAVGNAWEFTADGTADTVADTVISEALPINGEEATIGAWFNYSEIAEDYSRVYHIDDEGNPGIDPGPTNGYNIEFGGADPTLTPQYWSGGGIGFDGSISLGVDPDTWYFVVTVLEGNDVTLYVFDQDGQVDGSPGTGGGTRGQSDMAHLIMMVGDGRDTPGLMDEVYAYSRALNQFEVDDLWEASQSPDDGGGDSQLPQADALEAYLSFDGDTPTNEVTGTDASVVGEPGTGESGVVGSAFSFTTDDSVDSVADAVVTEDLPLNGEQATVGAWFNYSEFETWARAPFQVGGDPGSFQSAGWDLEWDQDTAAIIPQVSEDGSPARSDSSGTIPVDSGTWYFVVGVVDGENVRYHVFDQDGELDSSPQTASGPRTQSDAAPLIFMAGDGRETAGLLDETYAFSTALSESEVAQIYEASLAGVGTGDGNGGGGAEPPTVTLELGSEEIDAGGSTTATTTVTNESDSELTDVVVTHAADDDGIELTTDDPTSFDSLASDGSQSIEWQVSAADDLAEGDYTLTAQVAYTQDGTEGEVEQSATLSIADSGPGGIDPATTIELDGFIDGWEATAPDSIAGETNPTLTLQEGEEYTVEWTNADGAPHDFDIWDADNNAIVDTEIVSEEGTTTPVTFTVTSEMATYVCSVHPNSMVGDIEVV